MRSLTVDAKTRESADALYAALSAFRAEITGGDGDGYRVTVELRNDREVVSILDVLMRHVSDRSDGPARVGLDGRKYTLHAD
jgi:hypothetical protein